MWKLVNHLNPKLAATRTSNPIKTNLIAPVIPLRPLPRHVTPLFPIPRIPPRPACACARTRACNPHITLRQIRRRPPHGRRDVPQRRLGIRRRRVWHISTTPTIRIVVLVQPWILGQQGRRSRQVHIRHLRRMPRASRHRQMRLTIPPRTRIPSRARLPSYKLLGPVVSR